MILVASAGLPNDCMILECVNIRFVTFSPFRPLLPRRGYRMYLTRSQDDQIGDVEWGVSLCKSL